MMGGVCTVWGQETGRRTNLQPAADSDAAQPELILAGPAEPASRLAIEDLEDIALHNNPTLVQAQAGIDQQSGVMQQAGLYPNPQVGYLRSDASPQAGQPLTNGMFFSQEFVTGGKLRLAKATEAQMVEQLRWEREAQQLRVLNDLRLRFYEVLGAERRVRIGADLVKVADEGLAAAEKLVKAAAASKPDVLQAEIQANTVRMGLQEAQYRYEAAWRELVHVAGVPDMQPTALDGTLESNTSQLDWDDCLQELFSRSPQLRAAETRINHAHAELRRERAQPIPNVSVQAVTQYDSFSKSTTVGTLVSVPVPIFNRNQGNISHAMADVREAEAEVARVKLVLRDMLADSFQRYKTAMYQVDRYRRVILPRARENLELSTNGYKLGEFNILQVLTARQTWFQSSLAYVDAQTNLRKVQVEIEGLQLTGGLNPATLGTALQSQPGGGRQRSLLNQVQEGTSQQALPGAFQSFGGR